MVKLTQRVQQWEVVEMLIHKTGRELIKKDEAWHYGHEHKMIGQPFNEITKSCYLIIHMGVIMQGCYEKKGEIQGLYHIWP